MKKYLVLLIVLLLSFGCTSFHLHTPDGGMKSKIIVDQCEETRDCTDEEPEAEVDDLERLQQMAQKTAGKFSDYAAQSDANDGANDTLLLYDANDAQEAGKLNQLTLNALLAWLDDQTWTFTVVTTHSGGIKSLTPVTDATTDFAAAFTGANLYGGTFVCDTDDGDLQLPAVGAGMNFTIITLGAIEIVAEPNASDSILLDGVQLDDADSATSLSAAGDIIVFQYYSAAGWVATSNGWTDED